MRKNIFGIENERKIHFYAFFFNLVETIKKAKVK